MALKKATARTAALGAAMLIGFGLCGSRAQAAYTLTIQPTLTGVTATGTGSIDFVDALTFYIDDTDPSLIDPSEGAVIVGPAMPTDDTYYSGITGPAIAFGSGDEIPADAGAGAIVGLGTFEETSGGVIAVPMGYVSGASLGTSTATWTGATIASLGLTPGSYVWTWGSGASADSFTIDIMGSVGAPPPVPEPATWAMMLLGLGGLALLRIRRRVLISGWV